MTTMINALSVSILETGDHYIHGKSGSEICTANTVCCNNSNQKVLESKSGSTNDSLPLVILPLMRNGDLLLYMRNDNSVSVTEELMNNG